MEKPDAVRSANLDYSPPVFHYSSQSISAVLTAVIALTFSSIMELTEDI